MNIIDHISSNRKLPDMDNGLDLDLDNGQESKDEEEVVIIELITFLASVHESWAMLLANFEEIAE